MKFAGLFAIALLLGPVSAAANSVEPDKKPSEKQTEKTNEPEQEKKICKRIAADMSSRRRTKVCLTRDEWKTFNRDQRRN